MTLPRLSTVTQFLSDLRFRPPWSCLWVLLNFFWKKFSLPEHPFHLLPAHRPGLPRLHDGDDLHAGQSRGLEVRVQLEAGLVRSST